MALPAEEGRTEGDDREPSRMRAFSQGIISVRLVHLEGSKVSLGVCALCADEKELRESHLIPAAVSKSLHRDVPGSQEPVSVTATITMQTSRQFKGHVFCGDCEERLNRSGEAWVLGKMARLEGFPLLDALSDVAPSLLFEDGELYETAEIPAIDAEKLAYFGLSMFWRTAVHRWKGIDGNVRQLGLGPYREPMRRFLLGLEPFPTGVVLAVGLWPNRDTVWYGTYLPRLHTTQPYHTFTFYIPGVTFILCTGKGIPSEVRRLCCYSGSGRPVFTSTNIALKNGNFYNELKKMSRLSRSLDPARVPHFPGVV